VPGFVTGEDSVRAASARDIRKDKELANRTEEEFKELVYCLVEKVSKDLGLELNYIYFRKMRTKWASLSSVKNLTINRLMKYLPEYLIRYVIFHEIAHLMEKRHNDKFWQIVSGKYKSYREMEREMFTYWFLVSKEYQQI